MIATRRHTRPRSIRLAAALVGLGCLALTVAGLALAESGDFDGRFSDNGIAKTGFGPYGRGHGVANAVAVQPNNRIVIAGATKSGHFGLARFRSNGKLDRSFGKRGTVRIDFGATEEWADDVAVRRDGRIVVVGMAYDGNRQLIGVARLRPGGALDPSFGTGGKEILDPFEPSAQAWRELSLALEPGGNILIGGTESVSGPGDEPGFVVRLESDGDLDPSFADGGLKTIELAPGTDGSTFVNQVIVDARGRIAAAVTTVAFEPDIDDPDVRGVMVRLRSNGDYDPSFSGNGWKLLPGPSLPGSPLLSIAAAPHGRLVGAGRAGYRLLVARVKGSGAFDRSFDGDGVKTTRLGMSDAFDVGAQRVIPQRNGKPLIAATFQDGTGGGDLVARFRSNGKLDRSFSGNGKKVLRYRAAFTDAAMQAKGKILLGGVAAPNKAFVARLKNHERPFVAP